MTPNLSKLNFKKADMKNALLPVLLLFILASCAPQKQSIQFVKYGSETYEKTIPDEIDIVKQRIDIAYKYVEIGVLKVAGNIDHGKIKQEAASYGANAILFEANNVVLFKYLNYEKEKPTVY